jgi:hypothetical protein
MKVLRVLFMAFFLVIFTINLTGCAQTMRAIENAKMQVVVKMSDTIFLDPATLTKNKTAYIRVTNTSDMQEISFEPILRDRLASKGISLVSDPSQAGYIIQANMLYMDYEKQGLTGDGMLAGGFGGAIAGASLGGDWKGAGAGALIGGAVGSLIGGAIGAAFKVETYIGVTDIQIQERVEGGVTGTMKADIKQGTSTSLQTERTIKADFQTYRTRILAKAKQTNIDRAEAARVVSERLATQIANMF